MRIKSFWVIGFVTFVTSFSLMTHVPKAQEQSRSDIEEILTIHKDLLASHLKNNVAGVLEAEADKIMVVSRGEVLFSTKVERAMQFERYLKRVEFEEYRDLISPIVRVSNDGTLGWLIAQVRIVGTQTDIDGTSIPIESTWAWIELYEKHDGRWLRVGEVSNVKPPVP